MSLAGERQRHHGASVESVLKSDYSGTPGMRASSFDCVLYRFSAGAEKKSLLRKLARRDLVHPLGARWLGALAWLLSRPVVTSPIVGATKPHHLEDAVAALNLRLSPEEIASLEEPYVPHAVAGFS